MRTPLSAVFALRWQPGRDTLLALLTALLMVPVYYAGTHFASGPVAGLLFAVLGNGVFNVIFPAYYVLVVRREPLAELGITTRRLGLAVILSLIASFFMWKGLQRELLAHPDAQLWPQLFFNGVILWEPFFVYGWLQLRFERAFGLLPGILLAAVSFGAYHLGTYPLANVIGLGIFGVVFGVLFRTTRNLLVLWPLTWSLCSSIGTLQGGMHFGWNQVVLYGIILVVQIAVIAWMAHHNRTQNTG